ncbi:hypothetical protein [Agrococcus jenensis]|uniref:Uncharacterized protein n=1 Tax=Agrococcus jenensis TaxID=46353 RepID=A0A3N2ASI5_9MICO|nr:hypothetical protein [Agrococcus jenensis]ROR65994.1 hypothetical protein EDD26_1369 [Agrococcus jenensis]
MSGRRSASEWVRERPRGARVDWAELEARVLRDQPAALRSLGVAGRVVRTEGRGWQLGFGIAVLLATVVGLAVVWAPIWGLATLAGDAFGRVDVDGATAIPVAGIAMVVAGLAQVVLLLRTVRGRSGGDGGSIGAGIAVLGVLTAVGIAVVGDRQDVPAWQAWFAVALVGAGIGALHAVLARRARPRGERATSAGPDPEAAAAAVRELDPAVRGELEADRRAAVEWLRLHGAIGPDEAAAALDVELGRLGATLGR